MKEVILKIDGMTCSACSNGLEKYLRKQKGIVDVSVNLVLAQAKISYEEPLTLNDLERFIKEDGFKSLGIFHDFEEKKNKRSFYLLLIFAVLAVILLYFSMGHMIGLPMPANFNPSQKPISYTILILLLTIPFFVYGVDILKNGIKNLIHRMPNMDTLISLGVLASFFYSFYETILIFQGRTELVMSLYYESVAIVIFFVKLGRFIDSNRKEKTKDALKELVQITPLKAYLKEGKGEREVTIDEVKKGDLLVCKPGMKVAVDGEVISGESYLDQAFLTGESVPVKKKKGDQVLAGSINQDGYFEYKALRIGKNSTISEMVRMVMEAANTKAPMARLADRISQYFVPIILALAVLTFLGYLITGSSFGTALNYFVTVLVVACPCALGLATPLALVISIGESAKHGILIKSSEVLEKACQVDTICFDKTGTLTYGNLKISRIYYVQKMKERDLLPLVASLEAKGTHPIGKAFLTLAKEENYDLAEVSDFKTLPGIGLEGNIKGQKIAVGSHKLLAREKIKDSYQEVEDKFRRLGNSIVYVLLDQKVVAVIGVKDIVRDNSIPMIRRLQKQGKEIIMLTGDNEGTASIIASQLGIQEVKAEVTPKEKMNFLKELQAKGKKVMMVGDGINDAPSLAGAYLGVSIGGGTDIANDSSDVILVHNNLKDILTLFDISKRTVRNMKQNLFWAFFYNICMIPLAMGIFHPFGLTLNPMIAALAMTLSSLTVILNALRLKIPNRKEEENV